MITVRTQHEIDAMKAKEPSNFYKFLESTVEYTFWKGSKRLSKIATFTKINGNLDNLARCRITAKKRNFDKAKFRDFDAFIGYCKRQCGWG